MGASIRGQPRSLADGFSAIAARMIAAAITWYGARMLSRALLGQVEPYQQIEAYSCGAAALKAVLGHWDDHHDERMLIDLIGVDPERGSTVDQVARAARNLGYDARPHRFSGVRELRAITAQDTPVIIAVQSFNRPNQGHFVVAVDVKDDTVEIMDPNTPGNWRVLSHAELDRRWRFRDRYAVLVRPRAQRQVRRAAAGLGATAPRKWAPLAAVLGGAVVATAVVLIARTRKQGA